MSKSDGLKLGSAVALTGLAVMLLLTRSRAGEEGGELDDSRSYWYCTTADKSFSLTGAEYDSMVRTMRPATQGPQDAAQVRLGSDDLVTLAMSPYSHDYTGVRAMKCEKCGEVFRLQVDKSTPNACPKCKWTPSGSHRP